MILYSESRFRKFPYTSQKTDVVFNTWIYLLNICTRIIEEGFEDIKVVIRVRKLKDRQHNCQKGKDKRTNNDLRNTTQKTVGVV